MTVSETDVYVRKFQSNGTPLGSEFRVHTNVIDALDPQKHPGIALFPNGQYVVAFDHSDDSCTGDCETRIYARIYDANDNPIGSEFLVSTDPIVSSGLNTAIDISNGNCLIVWSSKIQSPTVIYGKIIDSSGATIKNEFAISSSHHGGGSSLSTLANGNFLTLWNSQGRVYGRILDPSGNFVTGEILMDTDSTTTKSWSVAKGFANGNFIAAWIDNLMPENKYYTYAKLFDSNGTSILNAFRVSSGNQSLSDNFPTIAILNNSSYVIAWSGQSAPGDEDIYSQQF